MLPVKQFLDCILYAIHHARFFFLVSLLFAVVILLSCVVVYQFVEPQEVKGEEHQTLGLSVSPFGSTFKLGVNQSKTFTAQALNGSAPFCFSWKIVPSAPLTL